MSFVLPGFRTEDIGEAYARGIHCAQPMLRRFGLESTIGPSLALYNTARTSMR